MIVENIRLIMVVGESKVTNMFLRMLGNDVKESIEYYLNDVCSRTFLVMNSMKQVNNVFGNSVDSFLNCLNPSEMLDLRSYTGYNFKNINAILRGNWNYEVNGYLDQNKSLEYRKLASNITSILNKFDTPNIDFITFRGTTLDSFSSYGIYSIADLENLEGKFLYEQGFTSTSILESSSYSNKKLDDGRYCNVSIRYLIPAESTDGALLVDDGMSYSTGQNEFLLNSGSLTKIIDVKVDMNTNTAILTGVLVPKNIYDLDYAKSQSGTKNI